MKCIRLFSTICLLFFSCLFEFENPSDPKSDDYTVRSRAVLKRVGDGDIFSGDTIFIFGGISSKTVEAAALVTSYRWDLDGDGTVDTVLNHSDTLPIVFDSAGTWNVIISLKDRALYIDTDTMPLEVLPEETEDTVFITVVIRTGPDELLTVDLESWNPVTVVAAGGDTLTVVAQSADSISIFSPQIDTVTFRIDQGDTVFVETSPVRTDTIPPPDSTIYLPGFPEIPGFPDIEQGDCAFYAEDSSLMRTTLEFYDVMWEQTRSDGIAAIEFVEKLVGDILGYAFITLIDDDYDYTFDDGVYLFTSGDFDISCAFHYGEGIGDHAENDTVRSNLFALSSYVSGLETSLTSPFYTFNEGPLFDLIDGDLSIDRSLNVSFSVNFAKLKVSFSRAAEHAFSSLPLYIVNDSVMLTTVHKSYASMVPVYMRQLADRFHQDSIVIDHSGSSMNSEPVALTVTYRSVDSTYREALYTFAIQQVMDRQVTAYGDRDGVLKLVGDYETTATLSFDGYDQTIYFEGVYSSTESDSSWFYCDGGFEDMFGTLFFGEISDTTGLFTSGKYDYTFPYTPLHLQLDLFRSIIK